jgi:hypothetical protein
METVKEQETKDLLRIGREVSDGFRRNRALRKDIQNLPDLKYMVVINEKLPSTQVVP